MGDLLAVLAGGARDRADGMNGGARATEDEAICRVLRLGLERTTLPSRGRRGPSTGFTGLPTFRRAADGSAPSFGT